MTITDLTMNVTIFSLSSLNEADILSSNFWLKFSNNGSVSRWLVSIFCVKTDSTFSLLFLTVLLTVIPALL